MKCATAWSTTQDLESALSEGYGSLVARLGASPDMLLVSSSSAVDSRALVRVLDDLAPDTPVHGSTSCLGVMTERGFHSRDGLGVGLIGVADPGGRFGVGAARIVGDPQVAATDALIQALKRADREGAVPMVLWLSTPPGVEERVIEGIESYIGHKVPVIGGTAAADETDTPRQFVHGQVYEDAVVISAMFPTTDMFYAFHCGFEPTPHRGQITRSNGRTIVRIDDRPAAQVYDEWTGGALSDQLAAPGAILAHTALSPLGRKTGEIAGMSHYTLSQPRAVLPEGALSVLTDVRDGDELVLMTGTAENLIGRAGRVARAALTHNEAGRDDVAGALVVFGAGAMLAIRDRMDAVVSGLRHALGGKPFLGTFSFGQQGCFTGGRNQHGNLMVSVVVFSE